MDDQTMELLEKTRPPIASTKDHAAGAMTRTSGPARRPISTSASPWWGGGRRRYAEAAPSSKGLAKAPARRVQADRERVIFVPDPLYTYFKRAS